MARPRVKCQYGCGYRNENQYNLARHEARCTENPDRVAPRRRKRRSRKPVETPVAVEATEVAANGAANDFDTSFVAVLNAKFPRGIKTSDYPRVLALLRTVESG